MATLTLQPPTTEMTKELCEASGCDVNKSIEALIANGVDLNGTDKRRFSPLTAAVANGHVPLIDALIAKGADTNRRSADPRGGSLLHFAIGCSQDEDTVDSLIIKGVNLAGWCFVATVVALAKQGIDIDGKNTQGESPLHVAAVRQQLRLMKVFIANGADLDARDLNGNTVLHGAVRYCNLSVLETLVGEGANTNAVNQKGRTPLFNASNIAVIKFLISHGANLNVVDENGLKPYQCIHLPSTHVDYDTFVMLLTPKDPYIWRAAPLDDDSTYDMALFA